MKRSLLAAVAALLVVACSGGAPVPTAQPSVAASTVAPSSPPNVATAPTGTPAPQPPATSTPGTIQSPPASDGGATNEPEQTFHGAVELEALIPDQVGDITLDIMSLSGQEWFDSTTGGYPAAAQLLNAFLAALGASIDDVSAAGGSGFSDSSDAYVYVMALRVAGADSADFLSGTTQFAIDMIPLTNSGMSGTATPVTLGGKNATLVTAVLGGSVINESYYYGYGDVVFRVSGDSEETVGAALALLP